MGICLGDNSKNDWFYVSCKAYSVSYSYPNSTSEVGHFISDCWGISRHNKRFNKLMKIYNSDGNISMLLFSSKTNVSSVLTSLIKPLISLHLELPWTLS